jgi:hypothetical protein
MLTAGDAERNLPRLYWNTEPLLYVGVYAYHRLRGSNVLFALCFPLHWNAHQGLR